MKTILIIDDNLAFTSRVQKDKTFEEIRIILAGSFYSAKIILEKQWNNLDLICVDACIENNEEPDSEYLIEEIIKRGFKGAIIACSGNDAFNDILIKAGATHKTTKTNLIDTLLRLSK